MQNREIDSAISALKEVAKKQLPVTIALRMATARRKLEEMLRDIEDTKNSIVVQMEEFTDGEGVTQNQPLTPVHPNFIEARKKLDELMSAEFEAPDTFELFVRVNGDEEEFCWTSGFKTMRFKAFEGELVYGMLPLLDVKYDG